MSIDAMKQALEALRKAMQGNLMFDEAMEAFKKLDQAIEQAERQEPVAHLIEYGNGEKELRFQPNGWGDKVTPLYAMPQPIEAQKLVAWLTDRQEMYFDKEDARRYSDGFIQPLYAAPPQRQPLTEAELKHLWETIYDHGNGKYEGRQSREQRERAFAILNRIGGEA
jgi:hypothetical protein